MDNNLRNQLNKMVKEYKSEETTQNIREERNSVRIYRDVQTMLKLKVNYATVHLLNGLDALKAANVAAQKINLKLLGVSVLTSFDNNDCMSLMDSDDNSKDPSVLPQSILKKYTVPVHVGYKVKSAPMDSGASNSNCLSGQFPQNGTTIRGKIARSGLN